MRSSSTERPRTLPDGRRRRAAWLRLALVAVLAVAGVAGPATLVGRTGALYTDVETIGFDASGEPTAPPTEVGTAAVPDPGTDTTGTVGSAAPAGTADPTVGDQPSPTPSRTTATWSGEPADRRVWWGSWSADDRP